MYGSYMIEQDIHMHELFVVDIQVHTLLDVDIRTHELPVVDTYQVLVKEGVVCVAYLYVLSAEFYAFRFLSAFQT
jgi:hypothetical protein